MIRWIDYVAENLAELGTLGTPGADALLALFEPRLEWENGELVQYLASSAADSMPALQRILTERNLSGATEWFSTLAYAFGGVVPAERDDRTAAIAVMPGFADGLDPFESLDVRLRSLMPRIDELAAEIAAEVRGSLAAYSGVHAGTS